MVELQRVRRARVGVEGSALVVTRPLCSSCKHFNGYMGRPHCLAFGARPIPDDILLGRFDHRKRYPGDHNIQYEPAE